MRSKEDYRAKGGTYNRTSALRTLKGKEKQFKLARVQVLGIN